MAWGREKWKKGEKRKHSLSKVFYRKGASPSGEGGIGIYTSLYRMQETKTETGKTPKRFDGHTGAAATSDPYLKLREPAWSEDYYYCISGFGPQVSSLRIPPGEIVGLRARVGRASSPPPKKKPLPLSTPDFILFNSELLGSESSMQK